MRKPRLVVVGSGVGGAAAVVELRKEGYHGVPIDAPARDFGERPDQRLRFSSVGTGSGRFAPDATSQIPPNRSRRRSPCPAPVSPRPISVRFVLPPRRKNLPKQSAAGSAPTATYRAMMPRLHPGEPHRPRTFPPLGMEGRLAVRMAAAIQNWQGGLPRWGGGVGMAASRGG